MLTNLNIYNMENKRIGRKVPISRIQAFTKSEDPKNFNFVIHFENEYDYYYSIIDKKYGIGFVTEIMKAI